MPVLFRVAITSILLLGFGAATAAAAAETRPIVVELFTSQGCSSCPPADALLGELARRKDVLALGYHVTYWNKLGWQDPLSSQASTDRQYAYARRFDSGRVYTPQIVVDGTEDMVGSDRAAVFAALDRAARKAVTPVDFAADRQRVSIGAGGGSGVVLLLRFVRHRTTHVGAGENAGRALAEMNGVVSLSALGEWTGTAISFPIAPPAPGEGLAVLVQARNGGMLGAAAIESAR